MKRCRKLTPAEKREINAPPESNAGVGWPCGSYRGRPVDDRLDDYDVRQALAGQIDHAVLMRGSPKPLRDRIRSS